MRRPGGARVIEVWRVDRLPADLDEAGPLSAASVAPAADAGLAVRVCTFPPDTDMDEQMRREYDSSVASSYTAADGGTHAGVALHRTDTVDVLTVVRGELTLITETAQTVLRQGDSVVQRGTAHAWSNRTSEDVVVVAVMIAAQK
jgi:mannose-6-phosphate isomerase-like protein (cupin superfamily)